jgi:hypothetical protein
MNSVAVVDLRGRPTIVRRFLTLEDACAWMQRLSEARSYEVFACVGDGIQQLDRDEQERVRQIRAAMDAQPAPSIGALSSPRYNDDGEEVRL